MMDNKNNQNVNNMENNNLNSNNNQMNINQINSDMNSNNNMNQNNPSNNNQNPVLNNNSNLENNPISQNNNNYNNQNSSLNINQNKNENLNSIVNKDNNSALDMENNKNKNISPNEIELNKENENKISNEQNSQNNNSEQNNIIINKDGKDNNAPKENNSISEQKDLLNNKNNEINNNVIQEQNNKEYSVDIYHYIKEEKIKVYFILPNKDRVAVEIPTYLTRIELYYTAYFVMYKEEKDITFKYKKLILLNHNKSQVKYDKIKATKTIKDKDEINIEELSLVNFIDVGQLLKKHDKMKKKKKIIFCDLENKEKKNFELPEDITISELMTLLNFNNVDLKRVEILFSTEKMKFDLNDRKLKGKKLKDVFSKENKLNVEIRNKISLREFPGKILEVSFSLNGKEKNISMILGSLEQINKFIGRLSDLLNKNFPDYKEFDFVVDGKQKGIRRDDERTFSSKEVNISSDFKCEVVDKKFKRKKSSFPIK
jgi:hypothetical protein